MLKAEGCTHYELAWDTGWQPFQLDGLEKDYN